LWYYMYHIQQAARDAQSNTLMLSACGGCSECHERRPPKKHGRDGGVVHALELMPRNRELLRNISRRANVSDIVYIHALAGANATATVRLSGAEGKLGEETGAACMPGAACTRSMEAVALDDFFERIGAAWVDMVVVDTEGWDALVVEGMRRSLAARRVGVFTFEFNYKRCSMPL
jgi:FkbM family methyltransferase